jgi:hypothetical protein
MGAMDKAKAVWDRLLDFEMTMASNRDMARCARLCFALYDWMGNMRLLVWPTVDALCHWY